MKKEKKGFIPNLAKILGEQSVKSACFWWTNQPPVFEVNNGWGITSSDKRFYPEDQIKNITHGLTKFVG